MTTREATTAEIIEAQRIYIEHGWKVGFRHFVRECYSPRAKNGVSHRQYSRGRIVLGEDGLPRVRHQGEMHLLTATHYTGEDGTTCIFDLRIKSEYLK